LGVACEKILIVEDEAITASDLEWHLGRLGYQISAVAASGDDAVRMAEETSPDLVLMDVRLAGTMDGLEASRRIQEKRPVPIVYLTAYPDIFLKSPAEMGQPNICIIKPFSSPALQRSIEIALRGCN
jgi:CheY-like chemotaxis protein